MWTPENITFTVVAGCLFPANGHTNFYIFSSGTIQKVWTVLRPGMRSQGCFSLRW